MQTPSVFNPFFRGILRVFRLLTSTKKLVFLKINKIAYFTPH